MEIYKKLLKVKQEIGKISKDSTNPFFKSKYFDINSLLEHCDPLLQKHGLLLLQPISNGSVTSIIYDVDEESGENYMSSSIHLPTLSDPQKLGSAITYYRRYTLQSLLGLQAEDDDANSSTKQFKEDARPWLDDKGLTFLLTKGSKDQINKAFKERRMKKDFKNQLEDKLKSI